MNKSTQRILFVVLVTAFLWTGGLQGAHQIVVKAVASEDYVKDRARDESKKIQTYQFMQGRFFRGMTRNDSLKEFTFTDIIQDMAHHLVRQNYYPNPVRGEGDLLIVVHYGVTDFEEDFMDMMGYTSLEDFGYTQGIEDAGGGGVALDPGTLDAMNNLQFNLNAQQAMNSANESSEFFKAQLLGMEGIYYDRISPHEEYELRHMLKDERYFVILMAYDYPHFRETGKAKLLWSTRYSIRAVGQSFGDAIKDMNLVAGDYFGQNLKGLNKKRVTDNSRVEMGDIEVIGQEAGEERKSN